MAQNKIDAVASENIGLFAGLFNAGKVKQLIIGQQVIHWGSRPLLA